MKNDNTIPRFYSLALHWNYHSLFIYFGWCIFKYKNPQITLMFLVSFWQTECRHFKLK